MYVTARNRNKPRTKGSPMGHSENGWPHFSTKFPHFCMCLDSCCQGENGCKCRLCICRIPGIEHGKVISDPTLQRKASRQGTLNVLTEKERSDSGQVRSIFQRGATEPGQDMRENASLLQEV